MRDSHQAVLAPAPTLNHDATRTPRRPIRQWTGQILGTELDRTAWIPYQQNRYWFTFTAPGVASDALYAWRGNRCLITLREQAGGYITQLSYFWTSENADCSFQSAFCKTRKIRHKEHFSLPPLCFFLKSQEQKQVHGKIIDTSSSAGSPWYQVQHRRQ